MKTIKYIIISFSLILTVPSYGFDKEKLEHRIVAGFNLGATTPTSIPREIRGVESWWPQFTPQLGYNMIYNLDGNWSVGTGIYLDYRGMGVRDKVKNMRIEVRLEDGGEMLSGYFTGTNETRVKSAYVTIPLFVRYQIASKWHIRTGGYASYAHSTSFKGKVWDGYLRTPDPTGVSISFVGDDHAVFDFGKDMREFDFGLLLGTEMKVNKKFNVYANVNWGLSSIFPSDFKTMDFKMYNVYVALGLAYKL